MKFTTIWSLPGLPLKERIDRTLDCWAMNLADILPKRASYWIALRQIGKATMTSQNVPATSLDNVLQNLGNIKDGKPLEQYKWDPSTLKKEHATVTLGVDPDHEHVHVAPSKLPPVVKGYNE